MNEAKFWKSGYTYAIAALCFIIAGLYTFHSGFGGLLFNLSVSNWDRVDAQVKSVNTAAIYAAKRRVVGYALVATYSYVIEGKEITSNSVAPDATFGFDQVLLAERKATLSKLCSSNTKLKIFVNSKKTDQSFIFRNTPIKPYFFLFAGSLFLTVAFILILMFLQKKQHEDAREEKKLRFPEQPWRWESFWQTFELRAPSNISKIFPIWGLTIFLGIISIISATIVGWTGNVDMPIYFGVSLLFIAWFVSVKFLVNRVKGLKKTDGAKLIASSYPVVLGERWPGRIVLPHNQENSISEVKFALHMLPERFAEGSFKPICDIYELEAARAVSGLCVSAKFTEAIESNLDRDSDQSGRISIAYNTSIDKDSLMLDFELLIPEYLEETDLDAEDALRWMLELSATDTKINIFERFPIPVFKRSSFSETQINS